MMCMVYRVLNRILLLFGIMVLGFTLSGCAGHKHSVHSFYASPEAALRAHAKTTAPGNRAFTCTAKIEIDHHGNRYPLKAAVMMKRPAFLRVESIPLIGPPDLYLSIAEGELRVFLPEKGAFYIGCATPQNISRFFPVFIPATDMIPVLMGVPPENAEETESSAGEREEGLYRVDQYESGRKTCSLWIDPADGLLTRFMRFMEGGGIVYQADFSDHTRVGENFLPQQITIRIGDVSILKIRYRDLRQFEADPESFPLQIPEGMIPIPLDP